MSEALTAPDFTTIPVGPLALIALPGCEELAAKIDAYLKTWREIRESEHKRPSHSQAISVTHISSRRHSRASVRAKRNATFSSPFAATISLSSAICSTTA